MKSLMNECRAQTASHADGRRHLRVEFGGFSSAGRKSRNEDAFAAHQPKPAENRTKGITLCIADGAGCSDHAQLASRTSVELFISDYYSTPESWPVKIAVARVLSALNAWLFHHGRQSILPQDALVTTFSAVVLKSNSAHLFHVGDSRIWRYRAQTLELLTHDHLNAQRNAPGFLTRALGMDSRLEVDYFVEELQVGDVFLLSTDGLHQVLNPRQMSALLTANAHHTLEHCAQSLVEAALCGGSDDNVSCLLARVTDVPLEDIEEVHRRLTRLAIPPVLEINQRIDGFVVRKVLHNGTRSHVYLVKNETDGALYALKTPSENFAGEPAYLESFIREAWIGARIDHVSVMRVFPRPDNSPFLYLLCEYLDGQTLRSWMFDNPHPPLETARGMLREIAAALRAFQRLHMVHRDLKPENIMVMADGSLKIIDFGTVAVGGLDEAVSPLREEVPVGAANYLAPEYLAGYSGAHVSDIFSVGVIAYELLTGELPFKARETTTPHCAASKNYRYIPARDRRRDLPLWIDLALRKSVEPRPEARYQALSEFMHDLCVPNNEMLSRLQSAPMLERDPVAFWRGLALILMVVVLLQGFL